jgi:rhamnosyltransferase
MKTHSTRGAHQVGFTATAGHAWALKNDPLVSIILRSYNEAWALRDTLRALQAQEYKNWELIVIDSGSTDDSADLIRKAFPRHFLQIAPQEYNPSRVLNQGMRLARAEYAVCLNADATPQGRHWLRPMVEALFDPRTAAVFGRQIPRLDCQAVFARDYETCFGPQRESSQWDHFFSMASSGLRKDVWAKRGFLEALQYSEDDEYTRWCKEQGYVVGYCPESVAMHSHNYTASQAYKRSFGEGRALAAVWQGSLTDFNWRRTVLMGWLNDARRDLGFCARLRRLDEWPHALSIRWQQRCARLAGFRDGWDAYRQRETDNSSNPPLWIATEPMSQANESESLP